MKAGRQLKILLVILMDPDHYPPTINAANILAERGHQVTLAGIKYPNVKPQYLDSSVTRVDIAKHQTGIRNVLQYISFYYTLLRLFKRTRPDWVIAYDGMSIGPVSLASKLTGIKWIWHSHDLFPEMKGWYQVLEKIETRYAKRANIVSFPQEDRAEIFTRRAGLQQQPLIVYNGPRKKWAATKRPVHSELKPWVDAGKFIILYQGQYSRFFNLENLISALALLPQQAVLCMIGRELEPGLLNEYETIIRKNGLQDRVKILSSIPYDELPSVTAYCNVGVAKLGMDQNIPLNDYYLTGASNKISEYLAVGLPVLMADTPVNRKFYAPYQFAVYTDGSSEAKIAATLERMMVDNDYYQQTRAAAKHAGQHIFNYDTQFEKILNIIES